MGHNYRKDKDLEFLAYADNAMLDILVTYLTRDTDGEVRITESLTNDKEFIAANGNYKTVWKLIAAELQHFGGDTIVNTFRRKGILYREILTDVANRFSVKYESYDDIVKIEDALIKKIFEQSLEKLNLEQRNRFLYEQGIKSSKKNVENSAIKYQLSVIVAEMVAKQFGLTLTRAAFFPTISGIVLTIPMITGTAYRVTFPSVLQIALMRKQMLNKDIL